MEKSYRILIIGNPYDNHIVRFVKYLKGYNPKIQVDLFGLKHKEKTISPECTACLENLYLVDSDPRYVHVKGIRILEYLYRISFFFHKEVAHNQYDIINIHYPSYYHSFLLNDIKRITKKLVLTPWGSDVYRISSLERKIVKRLYDASDIVTGNGFRFSDDFMRIYRIPDYKFRKLSIYTDQIDYYMEHNESLTVEDAKRKLGIGDSFVITCGYNGNQAQRHLNMVEAINRVRSQLPNNLTLLFPFTYGGTEAYRELVKERVEQMGLNAIYFEYYLDLENLFLMRKATDMFIHIQTTDANNASLYEYLWFGKNIINGSWLKYPNIEDDDYKPYHVTPSLEELGETIIYAYQKGAVQVKPEILNRIERSGYKYMVPKWNDMFESII